MRPQWDLKALGQSWRHAVLCFLAAFRFLTIIPIQWRAEQDGDYFQHGLRYFPLIGGMIGVAVGTSGLLLHMLLPGPVVAVVMMILLAIVSGCLHLDGLADTADGFFSSRPKEKILEIMRDSRTGAMGVIAIVFVLLLKFAALSSLPFAVSFKAICLMPFAGRCAIVFSMAILPYARTEGGLGNLFYAGNCRTSAIFSLLCMVILAPIAGIGNMLLVCVTTLVVVLLFSMWCRRKIGGATGDTLGAVCEITEMAVAVGLAGALVIN